jgi:hypothetical protein
MDPIDLRREVDGEEKPLTVAVWDDRATGLVHARVRYDEPRRVVCEQGDGQKAQKAAEVLARKEAQRLRAAGWKDELTAEERARVDARQAALEAERTAREELRAAKLARFPRTRSSRSSLLPSRSRRASRSSTSAPRTVTG